MSPSLTEGTPSSLRRTPLVRPQTSVIITVPADSTPSVELLAESLPRSADRFTEYVVSFEKSGVAGELQRRRRDLRCVTAGSSNGAGSLREAGLREASGHIVALMDVGVALGDRLAPAFADDTTARAAMGAP